MDGRRAAKAVRKNERVSFPSSTRQRHLTTYLPIVQQRSPSPIRLRRLRLHRRINLLDDLPSPRMRLVRKARRVPATPVKLHVDVAHRDPNPVEAWSAQTERRRKEEGYAQGTVDELDRGQELVSEQDGNAEHALLRLVSDEEFGSSLSISRRSEMVDGEGCAPHVGLGVSNGVL